VVVLKKPLMYTVYVLYSVRYQKIYIGYTSNLVERFKSHNLLATKGWTIKFRPWQIIYTEEFVDKSAALSREKELKSSRGRAFIWQLITKMSGSYPPAGGQEFDPPLRN